MAISHNDSLRNALCAAAIARVDIGTTYGTGRLVIFDANSNPVATCTLSKPAFQVPIAGLAVANAVALDPSPLVGAVPVRFEVQDCNGAWVWRGTCGQTGDMTDIGSPFPNGLPVRIDNLFYRAPY